MFLKKKNNPKHIALVIPEWPLFNCPRSNKYIYFFNSPIEIIINLVLHCSYVLYGAFKSGKSTLLKILLNLCKQDDGHVYFYGKGNDDPMDVLIGYMPQQLGLEERLTVSETVMFYARLNGLKKSEVIDVIIEIHKRRLGLVQELSIFVFCLHSMRSI